MVKVVTPVIERVNVREVRNAVLEELKSKAYTVGELKRKLQLTNKAVTGDDIVNALSLLQDEKLVELLTGQNKWRALLTEDQNELCSQILYELRRNRLEWNALKLALEADSEDFAAAMIRLFADNKIANTSGEQHTVWYITGR
jgi:transcriptional regulator of aromatic amino acid metabolism